MLLKYLTQPLLRSAEQKHFIGFAVINQFNATGMISDPSHLGATTVHGGAEAWSPGSCLLPAPLRPLGKEEISVCSTSPRARDANSAFKMPRHAMENSVKVEKNNVLFLGHILEKSALGYLDNISAESFPCTSALFSVWYLHLLFHSLPTAYLR